MIERSIELLNKAVGDELSAVHQYMYFHFHCEDQATVRWLPCSFRPPSTRCAMSKFALNGFYSWAGMCK